ncbi:hypothetical protein [Streptomyces avicenniae]|uniref:hypothetical protein n=1 Tax=Streptomyces avicenniae TaxID=500153 RepID=UPI00069CA04A|nr:hypothetical protein [Streptomyces avicenniae]
MRSLLLSVTLLVAGMTAMEPVATADDGSPDGTSAGGPAPDQVWGTADETPADADHAVGYSLDGAAPDRVWSRAR